MIVLFVSFVFSPLPYGQSPIVTLTSVSATWFPLAVYLIPQKSYIFLLPKVFQLVSPSNLYWTPLLYLNAATFLFFWISDQFALLPKFPTLNSALVTKSRCPLFVSLATWLGVTSVPSWGILNVYDLFWFWFVTQTFTVTTTGLLLYTVILTSEKAPDTSFFARIIVVPCLTAFTNPFWSTVATSGVTDSQTIVLSSALSGFDVADNWTVFPGNKYSAVFPVISILVTLIGSTVIVIVSVKSALPCAVALIVTVPSVIEVTLPVSSTVATSGFSDSQVTFLFA